MKTFLRVDSVGGASGDMILSALADAGADLEKIAAAIAAFFPEPIHFHRESVSQAGVAGTHVSVHAEHAHDESVWQEDGHRHHHHHHHDHDSEAPEGHHHHHRSFSEIRQLLAGAPLSDWVKDLSIAVFEAIAAAESQIHGRPVGEVHFHEVGAWDSVADIVGACLALEQLGVAGVACGPLPAGTGTLRCAHGVMPNPAPATQLLLKGMTVTQTDEPFELVTPTGAALLRVWSERLEPVPATVTVKGAGIGFGSHLLNGRPNLLRVSLLEPVSEQPEADGDALWVLETNLDDANPEWIGAMMDDLLQAGAKDVWCTPILMKKSRPATQVSVLAAAADLPRLRERIFRSVPTFGIRFYPVQREALDRRFETVQTPYGPISVKVGLLRGEVLTRSPEFEACAAAAAQAGVPVRSVYAAASNPT